MFEPKPLFAERMRKLLRDEKDFEEYNSIIHKYLRNFIRCNTIKIAPEELKKRLEEKNWQIKQPFSEYPEIMIIENLLKPGELGKSIEHLLGYYYVQEISSMMPILVLNLQPGELVLDLCAAPGSKTTQAAARMENSGTIIANDVTIDRIAVLASNLERCGVANSIMTREDAVSLCGKFEKIGLKFDKILVDAPCSGEGNIRSSPKTLLTWNIQVVKQKSALQKKICAAAVPLLKENGSLVYSTCTHAPEENEAVVSNLIENFGLELEKINLPLKSRKGISEWEGREFASGIENACRIFPQDNDSEGFFVAKLKKA